MPTWNCSNFDSSISDPQKVSKINPRTSAKIIASSHKQSNRIHNQLEYPKILGANQLIQARQYGFGHTRSTAGPFTFVVHCWIFKDANHKLLLLLFQKPLKECSMLVFLTNSLLRTFIPNYVPGFTAISLIDGYRLMWSAILPRSTIINSSVSQGSVLTPTIFFLIMNDLLSSTSESIHSYADDCTLHSSELFTSEGYCLSHYLA